MPVYRLDFLDRANRRVAHTYPFEARSDEAAVAFASIWTEDAPMELWCEDVRVRCWDAPEQH